MTDEPKRYRRILLKVSGEVLMGDAPFGIDMATLDRVAQDIALVAAQGIELCLVIGGGNIFRGVSVAGRGMERASADYMGMLATVMNALALQSALAQMPEGFPHVIGINLQSLENDAQTAALLQHQFSAARIIVLRVLGRLGSVPGFAYSDPMKNSGIVWSEQTLDQFLQGPRKMVPGTKMTYAGVADPQDRADLIAYLKQATK